MKCVYIVGIIDIKENYYKILYYSLKCFVFGWCVLRVLLECDEFKVEL